jgi:hypothetical protein
MSDTEDRGSDAADDDPLAGAAVGDSGTDDLMRILAVTAEAFAHLGTGASADGRAIYEPAAASERLAEMVREFIPSQVDPRIWAEWLERGGRIEEQIPKSPAAGGTSNQARGELARMKGREIRRLDAEIAKAEARVAELRGRREVQVAVQKTWLQHLFFRKLKEALRPVFAMGPAWVLMRSLAAYPATEQFVALHGDKAAEPLIEIEGDLYGSGIDPQLVICRTLQGLAGDGRLEAELFAAIYEVCKRHAKRAEASARGRRLSNKEFYDAPDDRKERLRNLGELREPNGD